MAKILLVEDDKDLLGMVRTMLQAEHHTVEALTDGSDAAQHLRIYPYDIIVLDWELPGASGIEILRQFRSGGGKTPIIMLTGRDKIDDKELGLEIGADDYLTKPFAMRELSARIKALLRRSPQVSDNILAAGDIELDPSKYRVTKNGNPLQLLPKEFAVLEFLLRHPNQVFTADALLDRVWKSDSEATAEALRTTMKRLRKKIENADGPQLIRTVHGVGYVLDK